MELEMLVEGIECLIVKKVDRERRDACPPLLNHRTSSLMPGHPEAVFQLVEVLVLHKNRQRHTLLVDIHCMGCVGGCRKRWICRVLCAKKA
jgi:hypothetical protein